MAILIDSDVLIQAERGVFGLDLWLESVSDQELAIAAITVAELWHGVERATRPHRQKRESFVLRYVLNVFPVIPYTGEIALIHARIWADLESTGRMIGDYDLILAATALHSGSSIATFNLKHFASVKGLKVIEPK